MKYPIGIQDFGELRRGGYVYVDKTEQIHRIISGGKYFFLSRPRRFGKSLLLSTLNELYSGSAKLFEALWIERRWDFGSSARPVIWIRFAKLSYKQEGVTKVKALQRRDIDRVVTIVNASFAEIPNEHWHGQNEHFFHALTHLLFSLLGAFIRSEVNTANGRCDAVVETDDYVYAFEFKRDKSAAAALDQIDAKGYLSPYADSPKQRLAVGINFSSAARRIVAWKVEER